MPDDDFDVTTTVTDTTASATASVAASPREVFDYVRAPTNHAAISGDATVGDGISGPALLEAESRFRMRMRYGPVPYRITSTVVEFDRDRVIAWCHLGGHRWRWEIEPDDAGGCTVTETYDQSTARIPAALRLMGYPQGHADNVTRSVTNVARHFAVARGAEPG